MNRKYAFTLLETSITILVIGIVMVFGINFQLKISNNSHENLTNDKLLIINNAIKSYVLQHSQLPCPADISDMTYSPDYGKELRNSNNECYLKNNKFLSNNLIYGTVPVRSLNLPSQFIKDSWRSNIVYIINKDYGNKDNFVRKNYSSILLVNSQNNLITDNALFLLFSSGKNQNGSFKNGGQRQIKSNFSDKENIFESDFNSIFLKDIATDDFDDIVIYEEKNNLLLNSGLEETNCSLSFLKSIDRNWAYTSNVNCDKDICQQGFELESKEICPSLKASKNPISDLSGAYKPIRKCLKYGKWSDIIYPCLDSCELSNIYSLKDSVFQTNGSLQDSIYSSYLRRALLKEIITLECINNKVGSISLQCLENGIWKIIENSCVDKNTII